MCEVLLETSFQISAQMYKSFRLMNRICPSRRMSTNSSIIKYSSETPGVIELEIVEKIKVGISPTVLKVFNDSHKHSSHHGMRGATNVTESHFRLEVVSDAFKEYKNQPARHRLIYGILEDEIKHKGVHALQLKTKTPEEYEKIKSQ